MNAKTPAIEAPANLTDFIIAEVQKQTSEAALRELVSKKIGETVAESVKRSFETYGDIGQQIKKAVVAALDIGDRVDVPAYGNMVMALLRAKMDETLGDLINKRLAAEMDEILSIAPKKLKLSAVVEAMISGIDKHDRYGSYATCIIEESEYSKGYWHVAMDPGESVKKYDCELRFGVTETGEIYSLTCDKKDAKTTVVMGYLSAYQKMVFAAYCSGSKLIIDVHEPSTAIGDF